MTLEASSVAQKNPYPPHGRSSEIPMGRGVLKAKILEAKYEAKLEYPGGMGVQKKQSSVGGVWMFPGTAHCISRNQNLKSVT